MFSLRQFRHYFSPLAPSHQRFFQTHNTVEPNPPEPFHNEPNTTQTQRHYFHHPQYTLVRHETVIILATNGHYNKEQHHHDRVVVSATVAVTRHKALFRPATTRRHGTRKNRPINIENNG